MNTDKFNDIALVAQVVAFHNTNAFNKLVVKYQSPLRRFFLNQTLGNEMLSDDLAQETFIKAYTKIEQFKGMSSFSTWLFRIGYNVYYDYVRKNKEALDVEMTAAKQKNAEREAVTERLDINKALEVLSEIERICVTLQLMEGQPIDKISEITGLPMGTVKSHLSRGKQKLSTYLKENGYERRR